MEIERSRPEYLVPEDLETLARQHVQMMAELWIAKDRLLVLETMLEKRGLIDRAEFENSEPEDAVMQELEAQRVAYIKRVIGLMPSERTTERLKEMAPNR